MSASRRRGRGQEPAADAHERVMMNAAFEFIGLLAPDGTLLEVNRAALGLIGLERGDVLGRCFPDTPWWPEESGREKLRAAIARAAAGSFMRYETTHVDLQGRTIVVDFSLTPVPDAAGVVRHLVAEGRDVTERRRAEDALLVSEQRLAGIISLAPEAIISVDEEQRIVLFNHGAEEIFGWTAAEILGQPLDVLIPQHLRARHREHIEGMKHSRSVVRDMTERGEIHGRRRDGSLFPAEASISRFVVGGVPVLTAVLRDVSERRAMEDRDRLLLARESAARAAAEAAESRARFLAELSAELDASLDKTVTITRLARMIVPRLASCCVVDVGVRVGSGRRSEVAHAESANADAAAQLAAFRWDPERPYLARQALLGEAELITQVTDAALVARAQGVEYLAALRELAPTSLLSVPMRARGEVLGAITLMSTGADRPLQAADLALAEEVADRAAVALDNARLYRDAVRAAELRDRTLGVVSHDLRGPLSAIGLAVRGLERVLDPTANEQAREPLQTILDASHLMQRLIQDLLDVASIEAGGFRIERRPADLLLLLVRAASLYEDVALQRGVDLRLELPDELPPVLADADRVLQVVTNLLDNALKFTSPGGTVRLRGEASGDVCHVTVADDGAGIPADELPHIFDRFWHVLRGAKKRGTGLGLTISKEIVERHGGQLKVTSAVGKGTTFTFSIPIDGSPRGARGRSAARHETPARLG